MTTESDSWTMPALARITRKSTPRCEKHPYPKKKDAVTVMNAALTRRKNHPKNLRAYFCRSCNAWHLTHHEFDPN